LVHVSNLYTTQPTLDLAQRLTTASPLPEDQPWSPKMPRSYFSAVHFGNSGTEANEAALKYARVYAQRKTKSNGPKILAFKNGFHGRTLGALAVTYTPKYREPYEPLMGGVEFLDFNDAAGVRKSLSRDFCAVIVEPVQGEGGLTPMSSDFVRALEETCKKHDVLIIADEVQTGLGRLGTLFASQMIGLTPDIITLAKPLAGGLPLSATLLPEKINSLVHTGDHGTTFGGGPVTTSAGIAVWDILNKPGFLTKVQKKAITFKVALEDLVENSPHLVSVKGLGMLRGVEMKEGERIPALLQRAREEGLLLLRSGTNVLRMAPALTIKKEELYDGIRILRRILEEL